MNSNPLLTIRNLKIGSPGRTLIRDVSIDLNEGETLALVGESGSGKSLTALSIMGLLPDGLKLLGGSIRFHDQEVASLDRKARQNLRGNKISMIFQEPMTALNPIMSIGNQLAETVKAHDTLRGIALRRRIIELLGLVRLPDPERLLGAYPHQLSGGMRQRVMIAMAMAGRPEILIADEPTTALDATIQVQILDMLADLNRQFGLAILLITHDLRLAMDYASTAAVMYAGRIVEAGPADAVLEDPVHPYTVALLGAQPPGAHGRAKGTGRVRLFELPGTVADPANPPPGCPFSPRCISAREECKAHVPPQIALPRDHVASCILLKTAA